MCRASQVGAEISTGAVPAISAEIFSLIDEDSVPGGTRQNLETANAIAEWNRTTEPIRLLLSDAQTSGGLLLSVSPARWDAVRSVLKKHRTGCAAVIGKIIRTKSPRICMTK
jgi:selenide,water dikinase